MYITISNLRENLVEERKVKILFYDLEVSRAVVEGYGNKWDFKMVKMIRPQELMCFSYMWHGDKKPTWKSKHDFADTKEFVSFLRDLLDEADIVVAHNANKFDNKMSNTYFIKNDVDPPSPYFSIDTLQVARARFKFPSNSLNDLCEYLGIGQKEKITYADLEEDFMSANPSSKTLRMMKKYNDMDVILLEKLYLIQRPYIPNHPNMARLSNRPDACPACGANGHNLIRHKYRPTKMGLYMQYKCRICKKYCQSAKPVDKDEDIKPSMRNIAGN